MASFALLDSLSEPGDPAKPNDDAFTVEPGFAAVFDGATGLGPPLLPGDSDAAWVARRGAARLAVRAREHGLRGGLLAAIEDVAQAFAAEKLREPAEIWEIPFAAVMALGFAGDGMLDALWYGDCGALVLQPGRAVGIVGDAFEKRAREAERVAELAAARGMAPASGFARAEFLPVLREARNRVNTEKGGWAFGPDRRAMGRAGAARIDAPDGTLLLLATDGFLALASDYARYDAGALVAAAATNGLRALYGELRGIEAGDPEGLRFPRFKSSDDATALLVRVVR